MPVYREKKDPRRIVNWLGSLTFDSGDTLVMRAVSGIAGMVGEVVTSWSGAQLQDTLSADEWTRTICDIAQDHCDATGQRSNYRLTHERASVPLASFSLKLAPSDDDGGDDEDASVAGQIRAQMAHTRMIMSLALRTPIAAMESMARQLDAANFRIAALEAERATLLDTYAEALQLAAVAAAQQTPQPTVIEQTEAWARAIPEMAKAVPLLMSGIKAITKV